MKETLNKPASQIIAELARKGAEYGTLGKMCGECAFKPGSVANVEQHNAEAALQCVMWGSQFNCHVNGYENAHRLCVGYQYAVQFFKKRFGDVS